MAHLVRRLVSYVPPSFGHHPTGANWLSWYRDASDMMAISGGRVFSTRRKTAVAIIIVAVALGLAWLVFFFWPAVIMDGLRIAISPAVAD